VCSPTLDVNATAPSISTGSANIELMPTTCYRNRRHRQDTNEHAIGTIKEETEPEVLESTRVRVQTNLESTHGQAHESSEPGTITTATTTPKPRARRLTHTQQLRDLIKQGLRRRCNNECLKGCTPETFKYLYEYGRSIL